MSPTLPKKPIRSTLNDFEHVEAWTPERSRQMRSVLSSTELYGCGRMETSVGWLEVVHADEVSAAPREARAAETGPERTRCARTGSGPLVRALGRPRTMTERRCPSSPGVVSAKEGAYDRQSEVAAGDFAPGSVRLELDVAAPVRLRLFGLASLLVRHCQVEVGVGELRIGLERSDE